MRTFIHHFSLRFKFIGRQVSLYMLLGMALGFLLFGIEILFATYLQESLVSIGAISKAASIAPRWLYIPKEVLGIIALLVIVGLIRCALIFVQSYIQNMSIVLSQDLFRRRASYDVFFYFEDKLSAVRERITHANNSALFVSFLQGMFFNGILLLFLFVSLFKLMPLGTLLVVGILGVLVWPLLGADNKLGEAGKRYSKEATGYDIVINRSLKNKLFIKISNTQHQEFDTTIKHLEELKRCYKSYFFFTGLKFVLPQMAGVILLAFILYWAGNHQESLGWSFITYVYLFSRATQTISEISKTMSSLSFNKRSFDIFYDWWLTNGYDSPESKKPPYIYPEKEAEPFYKKLGWQLQNVSFRYGKDFPYVLKNFSMNIEPGECMVIVGPSGVGKSTLLALLLCQQNPDDGVTSLTLDSGEKLDLEKSKDRLLKSIGYVGPETFIIEGSIYENLCYGSKELYSEESIHNALRLAECTFVDQLPHGIHQHLTEQGEGLSAGQKQRLSLARALLKKPSALVLDEATANLDEATEDQLISTFKKLKNELTLVVVTHRRGFHKIADHVLQLGENG